MYHSSEEDYREPTYHLYRCWLRSAPGMWATYDGHVDVWSNDEDDVFRRAVAELRRTSFPDRPSMASWRLERVQRLDEDDRD